MVFQVLLKLHALHYDSYQAASAHTGDPYIGQKHDFGAGIACGLTGNNCSVEGSGARGPGPPPLPASVRAKFLSSSRERVRGRGSHGSGGLFDVSSAQRALRGDSSSGSASLPPPHSHGFGASAYTPAHSSVYSLSSVHVPHGSGLDSSAGSNTPSSFLGSPAKPAMTNVSQAWGKSVPGAQFHSTASMVPQSSGTSFHFKVHGGVVDPTTVEVRGGTAIGGTAIGGGSGGFATGGSGGFATGGSGGFATGGSAAMGAGSWSWNSAKLMDKDYNLLVKPKVTNVADAWGKSAPASQFSSASLLPQSANSSFQFGLKNGVIDMSTVAVVSKIQQSSGRESGSGAVKSSYSWGKGGSVDKSKCGGAACIPWLIAPEVGQWLPGGMGPFA